MRASSLFSPSNAFSCFSSPARGNTNTANKSNDQSILAGSASPAKYPVKRNISLLQCVFIKNDQSENMAHWKAGYQLDVPGRIRPQAQRLTLHQADIGRGGFGSVSIFKDENGSEFAGKASIDGSKDSFKKLRQEFKNYREIHLYHENRKRQYPGLVGQHPNLVNIHGIAKVPNAEGKLAETLLMDAIPGPGGDKLFPFLKAARRAEKISDDQYWGAIQLIALRLVGVVTHISKAGMVHNDINPFNLIVNEKTAEPVVIDLGECCKKGQIPRHKTIAYASPESRDGKKVNEKSDLFSIGATLLMGTEGKYIRLPEKIHHKEKREEFERNRIYRPSTSHRSSSSSSSSSSMEIAYFEFLDKLLATQEQQRPTLEECRELAFLKNRILDDDAAKEVIKSVISFFKEDKGTGFKEEGTGETGPALPRDTGLGRKEAGQAMSMANFLEQLDILLNQQVPWLAPAKHILDSAPGSAIKSGIDNNGLHLNTSEIEEEYPDVAVRIEKELAGHSDLDSLKNYFTKVEELLDSKKAPYIPRNLAATREDMGLLRERAKIAKRIVEIAERHRTLLRTPE